MVKINRYDVQWSIPNAGPSESVFHFNGAATTGDMQASIDALRIAFDAIKAKLPNDVTIQFPSVYSTLNVETGQLVGMGSVNPPPAVAGTAAGGWAAGAGARVSWHTDVVRNGRKVVGTTYLVPLQSSEFDNAGRILTASATAIATAFNDFRAVAEIKAQLAVYSRPRPGRQGAVTPVIRVVVPTLVATLRKRKY